jgi:putative ABC transport system permease protein
MTRAGFVFRQVKARPLRAFLTAGAFAFSVGLLGFVMVLGRALEQDWSVFQGQRVIVMAKTSMFDKLPLAYLGKIQVDPGVEEVVPFDFMMGAYKDMRAENQVPVSGSDSVKLLTVYREATLTEAHRKAWVDDPTGCVIGPILAKTFGWKVGDRIVKDGRPGRRARDDRVGIFDYKADNGLYIHRKYLEQLTGDTGTVGMFWILAKTRNDVDRITKNLNAEFENAPTPARAMSEKQWQLNFMQMLGNVKLLFGSIAMATAFTLLLITANSLAMSARERRNQTGVLRAGRPPRSRLPLRRGAPLRHLRRPPGDRAHLHVLHHDRRGRGQDAVRRARRASGARSQRHPDRVRNLDAPGRARRRRARARPHPPLDHRPPPRDLVAGGRPTAAKVRAGKGSGPCRAEAASGRGRRSRTARRRRSGAPRIRWTCSAHRATHPAAR